MPYRHWYLQIGLTTTKSMLLSLDRKNVGEGDDVKKRNMLRYWTGGMKGVELIQLAKPAGSG